MQFVSCGNTINRIKRLASERDVCENRAALPGLVILSPSLPIAAWFKFVRKIQMLLGVQRVHTSLELSSNSTCLVKVTSWVHVLVKTIQAVAHFHFTRLVKPNRNVASITSFTKHVYTTL